MKQEQKIKEFIQKWQNFDWRDVRVHLIYDETVKEMTQDLTNLLDNWIKVEDELPEINEEVLVTIKYDEQASIAYFNKLEKWCAAMSDEITICGDATYENEISKKFGVTH